MKGDIMILMDHCGTFWPRPEMFGGHRFQKGDILTYDIEKHKFEAHHSETESLLFENNDDAVFQANDSSEIKQIMRLMASACGLRTKIVREDNTKIEVQFVYFNE